MRNTVPAQASGPCLGSARNHLHRCRTPPHLLRTLKSPVPSHKQDASCRRCLLKCCAVHHTGKPYKKLPECKDLGFQCRRCCVMELAHLGEKSRSCNLVHICMLRCLPQRCTILYRAASGSASNFIQGAG